MHKLVSNLYAGLSAGVEEDVKCRTSKQHGANSWSSLTQ